MSSPPPPPRHGEHRDEPEAGAIRPARRDEAAAVAALIQSAYRGEASRVGWTTEADLLEGKRTSAAEVDARFDDPRTTTLVLADAAGPLACCQVSDHGDGVAHLGAFAVRPADQGNGTGRRMVAAAEALAAERFGATTLTLHVIDRRTSLIAWYERLGFARTSEARPFPAGLADTTVLVPRLRFAVLAKALGPA